MPAVIPTTVLVLAEDFEDRRGADAVAQEIARGISEGGRLRCDLCPLKARTDVAASERTSSRAGFRGNSASALLDEQDFDRRMRAARAVVIACARLDDRVLTGSVAFEAATRARQAGVPAYAVTGENALDPFEARIVDLQIVLEARTPRALSAAGRKLAQLV